jgi:hypothetical protein
MPPMPAQLQPGTYIYTRRTVQDNKLQLVSRPGIYRVVTLNSNGVATLEGRCGGRFKANVSSLARCHLPFIDGVIDPTLAIPPADHPWQGCQRTDDDDQMLLCDACGSGWQTFCLGPPLPDIPDGDWICPHCIAAGVTLESVRQCREQHSATDTPAPLPADPFKSKTTRDRDAAAQALDNHALYKPAVGKSPAVWGKLQYKGPTSRPRYFRCVWNDGTVDDNISTTVLKNRGWLAPATQHANSLALTPLPSATPVALGGLLQQYMPGGWSSTQLQFWNTPPPTTNPHSRHNTGRYGRCSAFLTSLMYTPSWTPGQAVYKMPCHACPLSHSWHLTCSPSGQQSSTFTVSSPPSISGLHSRDRHLMLSSHLHLL